MKPEPEAEKETTETAKIDNAAAENPATPAKPEKVREPEGESNKQTTEPAVPIRKAIPVEPQEKKEPAEVRRAKPVKPLDQENEDETLLKSATPPPSDLNE